MSFVARVGDRGMPRRTAHDHELAPAHASSTNISRKSGAQRYLGCRLPEDAVRALVAECQKRLRGDDMEILLQPAWRYGPAHRLHTNVLAVHPTDPTRAYLV